MAAKRDGEPVGDRPDPLGFSLRVLGPVEVIWGETAIDVGGLKARALVARLLIDRNITVSVDRLVDSLWSESENDGAEIALRSTVSRVRKRLRDAGAQEDLIVTRAPGYALMAEAEATDVHQFEKLVAEGKRQLARGRRLESIRLLKQAQDMWRGSAYSEVRDEPFARAEARRLDELLLTAIETRLDGELTLGRHNAAVGELESLTYTNPMRERLWSQRMLALYRSGRQAEALRVFQELRNYLVDELGIEPGNDVSWMEQAILAQDPALDFPVPEEVEVPEAGMGGPVNVPVGSLAYRYLDAGYTDGPLVGRNEELDAMRAWWESVQRGEKRLLLIDGEAGIGKTRLAGELAHLAESSGALVLWGRCDEDPVAPFQPFAESLGRYFQSLSADQISQMPEWRLAELSRLVLRLSEYASPREVDVSDPGNDRFRFFGAVTATLAEMAAAHPVLLILDDLHWANQPTLLLLRHILRNQEDTSPGIVALIRDTEVGGEHPLRSILADLRAERTLERVHLGGLTVAAVEELIESQGASGREVAEELVHLTDGNPLFLDELVRQFSDAYRSNPAGSTESPVPPDLDIPDAVKELVARRVSRLNEDVIYLLQAAAVAGSEFDASIVAVAAELTPDQRLDAFDQAVESRLVRQLGDSGDRYTFSHALVREAIYGELLRGRRVRYHHKIAVATERAHADAIDAYANELAHHFYMGAALADADKAMKYCILAGERALYRLAFEEAIGHFGRGLEAAELYGDQDLGMRCDAMLALAEAQNKAGDSQSADATYEKAAALARTIDDGERLATAALRAGPLSYMGIVGANQDQVRLLEEAWAKLSPEDSHLRAMLTARLSLVSVYASGVPEASVLRRALTFSTESVAMARRLGDREALGYALNARFHVLWGIDPAPERLAVGTELGQIADDVGDELLALHGHMWRVRELLAQGDIDAVSEEIARFDARENGPRHPLASSYAANVRAMMALVSGDFETAERLGPLAMELAEGWNDLAMSFYGALMAWTWWQRDELPPLEAMFRQVIDEAPADYPVVGAALSVLYSEIGAFEEARKQLDALSALGWDVVAEDQTEGVALAMCAAAASTIGALDHAAALYEQLRPYAGTAVVIRAPAAACFGPADHYLGLVAAATGDVALAEVHFEAALRLARRMRSAPFIAAAEVELARTLRQGRREADEERVATLLRSAEEAAVRMGLSRIARMAAEPGL